jgi:hypothetical protein
MLELYFVSNRTLAVHSVIHSYSNSMVNTPCVVQISSCLLPCVITVLLADTHQCHTHTAFGHAQATEPVYLDKPLTFDWATGIGSNPRTNWVTSQAVIWDKCMALATRALSHADAVHNMVGSGAR